MSQSSNPNDGAVNLTTKQSNIYLWGWQPKARFRDAVCGRRFGKTFLAKAEMRRAARLAAKWNVSVEDEIWYGAPTFKQAKRVFWKRLKQAIPPSWRAGKPNETELSITLKSGHVIRVVGLDNYDDLRGSGLFFLIIDEWADCKWAAWEEVLRPMLSTCKYVVNGVQRVGGHVLRIGTPKGYNHCYETWMDGQEGREPDCKSWSYTSLQGGNIPESEIIVAKRKMDLKTFQQEYEASFESYQGVIYYCFNRQSNASNETAKENDVLHIGMDFNVTKMSAVVYVRRGDHMHAVDEFHSLFDTPAMIEAIQARYPEHSISVYPDASGDNRKSSNASVTDITMLRKAGFKIHVNASNPAVRDRINSTNAMFLNTLGERRLFVNYDKCHQFTKSLERQIYDDNGQPDKKSGLDHMCFSGDTIVSTKDGDFRFDQIPESGFVRGLDGDWISYKNAGIIDREKVVYRIYFANGYSVKCTPDHKFLTGDGLWIEAQHLSGKKCVLSLAQSKNLKAQDTICADSILQIIKKLEHVDFTELFGSTISEKYRSTVMCIISTMTSQTTTLKTLLASQSQFTTNIIQECLRTLQECATLVENINIVQKNGMQAMKVGIGTKSTISCMDIRCTRKSQGNVQTVDASFSKLLPINQMKTHFARTIAYHRIGEKAVSTMLRDLAGCAVLYLKQTNTPIELDVISIKEEKNKQDVYCLTTSQGAFKLSGLSPIVSNCDAGTYPIAYLFPIRRPISSKTSLSMRN